MLYFNNTSRSVIVINILLLVAKIEVEAGVDLHIVLDSIVITDVDDESVVVHKLHSIDFLGQYKNF